MTEASERPRRKRLSWESRCQVVAAIEEGVSPPLAAAGGGCSRATAYRLWRRYRAGGWAALQDRPSTPRRQPRRLSAEAEERIVRARRHTAYGPVRLAGLVPHPPSTIGKVLRRHGCSRLPRPGASAARCARRYEREHPGELLHVDTKQLGRFWEPGKRVLGGEAGRPHRNRRIGWQHLHVAIDDHSRLAYAELLAGRDADSCACFLARAVAWYAAQGIVVERVLTDNAKAYHARAWIERARRLGIERRYTHLPAADERQGRALHPDAAHRVGLRAQLSLERRPSSSARRLPALVQQTPPAQLATSAAADQPRLTPL
jgi:hypothetical protein